MAPWLTLPKPVYLMAGFLEAPGKSNDDAADCISDALKVYRCINYIVCCAYRVSEQARKVIIMFEPADDGDVQARQAKASLKTYFQKDTPIEQLFFKREFDFPSDLMSYWRENKKNSGWFSHSQEWKDWVKLCEVRGQSAYQREGADRRWDRLGPEVHRPSNKNALLAAAILRIWWPEGVYRPHFVETFKMINQ
ncbi:hypothetical protein BDV19DRAFT_393717 [Aspergillus venezuelensis]